MADYNATDVTYNLFQVSALVLRSCRHSKCFHTAVGVRDDYGSGRRSGVWAARAWAVSEYPMATLWNSFFYPANKTEPCASYPVVVEHPWSTPRRADRVPYTFGGEIDGGWHICPACSRGEASACGGDHRFRRVFRWRVSKTVAAEGYLFDLGFGIEFTVGAAAL
ncbi:hypothetical protein ACFC06_02620 [Nocardia sp. NPDC056064]|uniref:hypothetical protein n=1 Tax=Nocardia sp. NPDC056064 TaxID=3345701 RepID=UPI0035D8BFC7